MGRLEVVFLDLTTEGRAGNPEQPGGSTSISGRQLESSPYGFRLDLLERLPFGRDQNHVSGGSGSVAKRHIMACFDSQVLGTDSTTWSQDPGAL